jgi:hypothetical protein
VQPELAPPKCRVRDGAWACVTAACSSTAPLLACCATNGPLVRQCSKVKEPIARLLERPGAMIAGRSRFDHRGMPHLVPRPAPPTQARQVVG